MLIQSATWVPADGVELEDAAMQVVKSEINTFVVAGPGAGKTELLAQRACYLLQTNQCAAPQQILAISFKKDAAKNLAARVEMRCGKELARRFESLTIDAFAKRLVDRFRYAIPEAFRPVEDYEMVTLDEQLLGQVFSKLHPPRELSEHGLNAINRREFLIKYTLGQLPFTEPDTIASWAVKQTWEYLMQGELTGKPQFTFPMIASVAAYLLRSNSAIVRALRATYSHVFLDEFQDTTETQYVMMSVAFRNSSTILTAVGDEKQRIMGWAGALPNAFHIFERDFMAQRNTLTRNYRSAPKLVAMQKVLSRNLTDLPIDPIPSERWQTDEGICEIWSFSDHNLESAIVAQHIREYISLEHIRPRDICVLVKQKPDRYYQLLMEQLEQLGVNIRIESEMQDLIAEPLTQIFLDFIILVSYERAPEAWLRLSFVARQLRRISEDEDVFVCNQLETDLERFVLTCAGQLDRVATQKDFRSFLQNLIQFLNEDSIKGLYPEYLKGNYFQTQLDKFNQYMWGAYEKTGQWSLAIEEFSGIHAVPMMTIHKSKGLEYHTIIFIGLEDSAFWRFTEQQIEDTSAFFVAFSRAKKRAIFTFSEIRSRVQARENIKSLYTLLKEAGVHERRFHTEKGDSMSFEVLPYPDWSWSVSRDQVLQECPRKYYYQYYGAHNGWLKDATTDQQTVYRLKQLQNLYLVFGSLLHEQAFKLVKLWLAEKKLSTQEEIAYEMKNGLNQAYRESINMKSWWLQPRRQTMLHEIYYEGQLPSERVQTIKTRQKSCINHLFQSNSLAVLFGDPDLEIVEMEQLGYVLINETKVYVKLDLLYRKKDGTWVIVDWKTGKDDESYKEQVQVYALYLNLKYGVVPDNIRIRIENLLSGECSEVGVTHSQLEEVQIKIIKSQQEMMQFLEDVTVNKPKPKDAFAPLPRMQKCIACNYREVCQDAMLS